MTTETPVEPKAKKSKKGEVHRKKDDCRWGILKQLEWIMRHLKTPAKDLPKSIGIARQDMFIRLHYYRDHKEEQKDLFKMYHTAVMKREELKAKDKTAPEALAGEMAIRVIDEFLAKWDGTDPTTGGKS